MLHFYIAPKFKNMYNEENFIQAISTSFQKYQEFGARSTQKLKPIHKFLADTLQEIFGNEYEIHYLGSDTKEKTVQGKYYPKDIDMTITKNNQPVLCVGLKFVTSNYKQNANNYFENMMGETANIQANQGLHYAHVIILRHETPYYKKDSSIGKIEVEKLELSDFFTENMGWRSTGNKIFNSVLSDNKGLIDAKIKEIFKTLD